MTQEPSTYRIEIKGGKAFLWYNIADPLVRPAIQGVLALALIRLEYHSSIEAVKVVKALRILLDFEVRLVAMVGKEIPV